MNEAGFGRMLEPYPGQSKTLPALVKEKAMGKLNPSSLVRIIVFASFTTISTAAFV